MAWEYEFDCNSLSPAIMQSSQSFFYCILCRTLEDNIERDLNLMRVYSNQYTNEITDIDSSASIITPTGTSILTEYVNDARSRFSDKISGINTAIQTEGGRQTSYNNYHETARSFSDTLSLNNVTKLGLLGMDNIGSGFTNKFIGTSLAPQRKCFNDVTNSYDCPEMNLYTDLSKLTRSYNKIGEFIRSIIDSISGYGEMGCSETKGITMTAQLESYADQMPLDENHEFDYQTMVDDLTITPTVSTNLDYVQSNVGNIIDETLERIQI